MRERTSGKRALMYAMRSKVGWSKGSLLFTISEMSFTNSGLHKRRKEEKEGEKRKKERIDKKEIKEENEKKKGKNEKERMTAMTEGETMQRFFINNTKRQPEFHSYATRKKIIRLESS